MSLIHVLQSKIPLVPNQCVAVPDPSCPWPVLQSQIPNVFTRVAVPDPSCLYPCSSPRSVMSLPVLQSQIPHVLTRVAVPDPSCLHPCCSPRPLMSLLVCSPRPLMSLLVLQSLIPLVVTRVAVSDSLPRRRWQSAGSEEEEWRLSPLLGRGQRAKRGQSCLHHLIHFYCFLLNI